MPATSQMSLTFIAHLPASPIDPTATARVSQWALAT
jgi:hypothetical protein